MTKLCCFINSADFTLSMLENFPAQAVLRVTSHAIQKARRSAQRKKTLTACIPCKTAKVKCQDYRPCSRCKQNLQFDLCRDKVRYLTSHHSSFEIFGTDTLIELSRLCAEALNIQANSPVATPGSYRAAIALPTATNSITMSIDYSRTSSKYYAIHQIINFNRRIGCANPTNNHHDTLISRVP